MSTNIIFDDARSRPELFDWEGPVDSVHLEKLLSEKAWKIPADLLNFWISTGGGEMFESEYVLAPCGSTYLGDNLFSYNEELRDRGLPVDYVVFHVGMAVSAIRQSDGCYVQLDPENFSEKASFSSLLDWYIRLIRSEYAKYYRLQRA